MITICIASYNYNRFFADLFDSIEKQTEKNFKVILGIDGSESDLEYIKNNPVPAKVIYFPQNRGKYVTSNTLVNMADTSHILFFDADDIMSPLMIHKLSMYTKPGNVVRYRGTFKFGDKNSSTFSLSHGSFCIDRDVFLSLNGFLDWPIAADTEFMERCNRKRIPTYSIGISMFLYRQHDDSLTRSPLTGRSSKLRLEYAKKIRSLLIAPPKKLVTHDDYIVVQP